MHMQSWLLAILRMEAVLQESMDKQHSLNEQSRDISSGRRPPYSSIGAYFWIPSFSQYLLHISLLIISCSGFSTTPRNISIVLIVAMPSLLADATVKVAQYWMNKQPDREYHVLTTLAAV